MQVHGLKPFPDRVILLSMSAPALWARHYSLQTVHNLQLLSIRLKIDSRRSLSKQVVLRPNSLPSYSVLALLPLSWSPSLQLSTAEVYPTGCRG